MNILSEADQRDDLAIEQLVARFGEDRRVLGLGDGLAVQAERRSAGTLEPNLRNLARY